MNHASSNLASYRTDDGGGGEKGLTQSKGPSVRERYQKAPKIVQALRRGKRMAMTSMPDKLMRVTLVLE